jgi:hypothetical protein
MNIFTDDNILTVSICEIISAIRVKISFVLYSNKNL